MDYRLEQLRFELREDPSSRIFFKLGEHLRREGELDEAIEVLRSGLERHDRYIAAWVSLGRAQLDNGDAAGAQEALEKALELDPENAVAARAMGEAAIVNGEWVTAVKALKRTRGLTPQDDALDERIALDSSSNRLKRPKAAKKPRWPPVQTPNPKKTLVKSRLLWNPEETPEAVTTLTTYFRQERVMKRRPPLRSRPQELSKWMSLLVGRPMIRAPSHHRP
jgi:Flp pilus assembly protein TadD